MAPNSIIFDFAWAGKAVGINRRYVDRYSRRANPGYVAFKAGIAEACGLSNPERMRVPYTKDVTLLIQIKIDKRRDADSLLKPLFDGIQASGVIENDVQIVQYNVHKYVKKRGAPDEINCTAFAVKDKE